MNVTFPKYYSNRNQSLKLTPIGKEDKFNSDKSINSSKLFMPVCSYFYQPSFGRLKKSELNEFEFACAVKFKAPLEKFNTSDDFQEWANKKLEEKTDLSNYKYKEKIVEDEVKKILTEWKEYLSEDDVYKSNPALSMIIFDAITGDLSPETHNLPPVLHKGVLSDSIGQFSGNLKQNRRAIPNFAKMYQNNLRLEYTKGEGLEHGEFESPALWVKIPSQKHDPENFEQNVKKLKSLSHQSWCTRSTHAEEYLGRGDFYVYIKDNEPKVGIRFDGDKIAEIQGERNNGQIPLSYFDEIKSFVASNGFKGAERQIEKADERNVQITKIKRALVEDSEEKKAENIFKYVGMLEKVDDDGLLILKSFGQPHDFTFEELGVNENDLFKNVKIILDYADFSGTRVKDIGCLKLIRGSAKFCRSAITSLKYLEYIGGDAYMEGTNIDDLGHLKSVGGGVYFQHSKIVNLKELEHIGRDASFDKSLVSDLSKLKFIGGNANFRDSQIENLGELKTIGGYLSIHDSQVTSLGKLETIGKDFYCGKSMIEDLGELKSIGGSVSFRDTQITNLGKLQTIGGYTDFTKSKITSLGELENIGGNAIFENSEITDLGNLKVIGKDAKFSRSLIEDLGELRHIGGDAIFKNSKVTDLGDLESIGKNVDFANTQITDLNNLETIGGDARFSGSLVDDLGALKSIGGSAYFENSLITRLGKLEAIGNSAYLQNSMVEDLGNLKSIGGFVDFRNSKLTTLANLEHIGGGFDIGSCGISDLGRLKCKGVNIFKDDEKIDKKRLSKILQKRQRKTA